MKSGGRTELEAETEDVKTRLHLTPSLSEDHPLPYPLSIWLRPTSLPPSCRTATRTAPSTHKTLFWWVRDICLTLVLFMGLDYLYFKECSLERERERERKIPPIQLVCRRRTVRPPHPPQHPSASSASSASHPWEDLQRWGPRTEPQIKPVYIVPSPATQSLKSRCV